MTKLIVTRGLPGCGKTTWGDNYAQQHPNERVLIVNRDDLRRELFGRKKNAGGKWDYKKEQEVMKERDRLIQEGLKDGRTVISTDTNYNPKNINMFRAMARVHDAEFVLEDLYLPVTEAEERDARREEGGVGSKVIRCFWRENVCKPYEPVEGLPNAICVDIDGTIADMGDRDPYQEQFVEQDAYVEIVGTVAQLTAKAHDAKVIITSGRHVACKDATVRWLEKNGFAYDEIHMRPNGNFGKEEPDWKVKGKMYDELTSRFNIVCAFDDRQQVVDMLRERGIRVFQVADGRF